MVHDITPEMGGLISTLCTTLLYGQLTIPARVLHP